MRLGDIAGAIQETMESYEVEVGGKILPGTERTPFAPFFMLICVVYVSQAD